MPDRDWLCSESRAPATRVHFLKFEADIRGVSIGPACYVQAMISLMLLLGALTWLAVSVFAGWLLYRLTHRRGARFALTLFMLWLPFWDVIPGVILFNKAVREVGGVRIYRTVEAEGYLDLSSKDCLTCWTFLRGSGYDYIEFERTGPFGLLRTLETEPGFYEYRLLQRGDPRCAPFESLPNAERIMSRYGFAGLCVSFVVRPTPVSRYEYSREWKRYGNPRMPWRVMAQWTRIGGITSGDLLAESVQVHFASWLARSIGIPFWSLSRLPDGRYIEVRREDVMRPPAR